MGKNRNRRGESRIVQTLYPYGDCDAVCEYLKQAQSDLRKAKRDETGKAYCRDIKEISQ